MRKLQAVAAVALATGAALLVTGGLSFLAAGVQRRSAETSWRHQQEAHAAFHHATAEVSRKLQVGKIDDADWHREVESVSTQFKTDSEAAGKSWVDLSASASRLQFQSTTLLATGLIVVIAGMVTFAKCFRATPPLVAIHHN